MPQIVLYLQFVTANCLIRDSMGIKLVWYGSTGISCRSIFFEKPFSKLLSSYFLCRFQKFSVIKPYITVFTFEDQFSLRFTLFSLVDQFALRLTVFHLKTSLLSDWNFFHLKASFLLDWHFFSFEGQVALRFTVFSF